MELYYNNDYSFLVHDKKISTISSKGLKLIVDNINDVNSIYKWYELPETIQEYLNMFYRRILVEDLTKIEFNNFEELKRMIPEEFI